MTRLIPALDRLISLPHALRRVRAVCLALLVGALGLPGLAHAHGVNAAEMAPPILTAGILGFVCYWLVMLWPESKRADAAARYSTLGSAAQPFHGVRIKRKPRLRVIVSSHHAPEVQTETRRAADG